MLKGIKVYTDSSGGEVGLPCVARQIAEEKQFNARFSDSGQSAYVDPGPGQG
jgi:hypothetical protein